MDDGALWPEPLLQLNPTFLPGGTIDDLEKYEFFHVPYGIMKRRCFTDGSMEEHPIIFPNLLRQANRTQIRVPIDDEHTWVVYLHFVPFSEGPKPTDGDE